MDPWIDNKILSLNGTYWRDNRNKKTGKEGRPSNRDYSFFKIVTFNFEDNSYDIEWINKNEISQDNLGFAEFVCMCGSGRISQSSEDEYILSLVK